MRVLIVHLGAWSVGGAALADVAAHDRCRCAREPQPRVGKRHSKTRGRLRSPGKEEVRQRTELPPKFAIRITEPARRMAVKLCASLARPPLGK